MRHKIRLEFQAILFRACLRALCAVLRTGLHSVGNALRIKGSAHDMVTHTGEILNTSSTNENDAVLLQVVSDTGNIG